MGAALCVVGNEALNDLALGARQCIKSAFRPKTQQYYHRLYRNFVGFCMFTKVELSHVNVKAAFHKQNPSLQEQEKNT